MSDQEKFINPIWIYCRGHWRKNPSVDIKCEDNFSYFGKWGDKELYEHERLEINRYGNSWSGFTDKKESDDQ